MKKILFLLFVTLFVSVVNAKEKKAFEGWTDEEIKAYQKYIAIDAKAREQEKVLAKTTKELESAEKVGQKLDELLGELTK